MNRERIYQLAEEYLDEHPGTAGTVEPYVFDNPKVLENKGFIRFPFPILTDMLLSEDWEETDMRWFVDSSGFGNSDEPALTIGEFQMRLLKYLDKHPDHGFGVTGAGQFQCYVTAYRRVEDAAK